MGRIIARITEVKGITVKAELCELLPPYISINNKVYQAPKINSFVKTNVGLNTIICQIKGEYYNEYYRKKLSDEAEIISKKNSNSTGYFLDLTVIGYLSKGKLLQGLRVLPIVSANVEMLDVEDYGKIFQAKSDEDILLGNDLFDINQDIYSNINKLFVSHIGIFGNTGSGKSNTMVSLLQQYLSKVFMYNSNNSKTLIFDLNNEYGKDAIIPLNCKKIYNLKTRNNSGDKIHISFNDLDEDQMCVFLNATEKMQVPIIKQVYKLFNEIKNNEKSEQYFINILHNQIINSKSALFKSMRYHLNDYLINVDCFSAYADGNFYCVINGTKYNYHQDEFTNALNDIRITIPNDNLELFMFCLIFTIARESDNGANYDYIAPLISRYSKLKNDFNKIFDFTGSCSNIFENYKVVVVQLASVNNDMKEILPNLLSGIEYKKQIDYKESRDFNDKILSIVIDEAHNLLYEDESDKLHSAGLFTFEKIIKEGRKFATFLMIASQRPSDISNTIMSQLHNYFIHKLVNPNDLAKIRKTVAFLDEDSLNFISILGPGECVVSGTALSIPSFIKIPQVNPDNRPNSENIVLIGDKGIIKY